LTPIAPQNPLAKKLLWEAYVSLNAHEGMVEHFYPPQTPAEIVHLADAIWELGQRERLKELLTLPVVTDSLDPAVVSVRTHYRARLKL
jgi:hypothetical protein